MNRSRQGGALWAGAVLAALLGLAGLWAMMQTPVEARAAAAAPRSMRLPQVEAEAPRRDGAVEAHPVLTRSALETHAGAGEAPPSRRAEYLAAFDRKLARWRQSIGADCAEVKLIEQAYTRMDAVKERIIDSAVATDRGLKTKAAQRDFEQRELREVDTWLCRELERTPAPERCKRHFQPVCAGVLAGVTHW